MNKLVIVTAALLLPATARAGGYFIPNETARDLALAEAAIAAQHGAEAVILNIAALAGQEGVDVSANGELLVNRTDWSDPSLGSSSLIPQATYPPAVAIAYGARAGSDMAWGVGAGVEVPGGGSIKWPNSWPGQEAAQSVTQQVMMIAIGGAIQPLPYLKVGASYNRYQVAEEVHQSINYLDHFGDAGVAVSGGGNSFGLGAQLQVPTLPLSIAVTYKHSSDVALDGRAHFTQVPSAFETMIHDQTVTQKLTIPLQVNAGAAYEVYPDVRVMGAYSFERWSVYKADTFVGSDGLIVTVPRNYNNAHVIRLGGEWERTPFLPALTLRAGALRSISSQPSTTVSPTLTDASSWALSVGGGYNVTRELRIDLGYQHAFFDSVTASGMETLPGTYRSSADLLSLGLNWRTDLGFLRSGSR